MTFQTPDQVYPGLFADVHLSGFWPDGKLLSDALPLAPPDQILAAYAAEKSQAGFDLKAFFHRFFRIQTATDNHFKTDANKSESEHIRSLWDVLYRPPDTPLPGSSLIPLPYPYLVPGGRFNEVYYWDSYFTMLGLRAHHRWDIIEGMIRNFAWLIDQVGHIPNGNRSYFLGRSQPPF
ncbi:MAG: trehalase, partial [Saprospiraceae bacterium]|nr:trehalase [Saprospiraceae bacterium]